MRIFTTINEIKTFLNDLPTNISIGFVPTMGALHKGHISLISESKKKCDLTIVSIFVNPTQFNNPNDLKKYPRTFETDKIKLENAETDILFFPNEKEMYPEKDIRIFDFGLLDKLMEGAFRPGHFNGVAQIVSKLFDIIKPQKAFFGLKDFQQLAIIKELVNKYMTKSNIEIVACEIIREECGLAMSSRNELLTKEEKENAQNIIIILKNSAKNSLNKSIEQIKKEVIESINKNEYLKVEYFEIVDDTKLTSLSNFDETKNAIGCIAVFCGKVRLIDNIYYKKEN